MIAKAPIVRDCITTLILQIMAVPREIVSDDPEKVSYYTDIFDHANDEDLSIFLSRILQDTLSVPFGGAMEVLRQSDGLLHSIYHVDGGTLAPTYNEEYPFIQSDPKRTYNKVFFRPGDLVRIPWMMRSDPVSYTHLTLPTILLV